MSRAGFPEPMSGFDQIAGRFVEGSHPYASVPTLAPSAYPCNRSGASASFATLLLLSQLIVCCIHRLNLQPIPAIQVSQEPPVSENQVLRTWTPRSGHWRVHTTGQERSVTLRRRLSFRGPLKSESCRMAYGSTSAIAAGGLRCSIRQQSAAYLPFGFERSRTAALPSGECVLSAHAGHPAFSQSASYRHSPDEKAASCGSKPI